MPEVGESVNMTSELGVSFHSDNYAKKQNIDGKTEQLIDLDRKHSHLYNPRLPGHRDAQLINNTWGGMAEVLAVEKVGSTAVFSSLIVRF